MDSYIPLARGGQVRTCPVLPPEVMAGCDWTQLYGAAPAGTGNLTQPSGLAVSRNAVVL